MCYFITIGMQEDKSVAAAEGVPRGLRLEPVVNPSILGHLPDGVATFLVTKGMCSCGLFREEPEKQDEPDAIEKLRRKYQSKGWSPAKVERTITRYFADRKSKDQPYGLAPHVGAFLADVCDEAGELYVIVHWYQGEIEQERIELSEGPPVSSDELRAANPIRETDRIYTVVNKAGRR